MQEVILYLVLALSAWAHPTNTVSDQTVWLMPEWGTPAASATADSWPDGEVCRIRISQNAWNSLSPDTKYYIAMHEVGHCTGLWEPDTYHLGDGWMSGVMQMTAFDRFRVAEMHPSPIVRRAVIPMVSH